MKHGNKDAGMEGATHPVYLSKTIITAIETLWPEMPHLFGDQWPSVEDKVVSILRRAYCEYEISLGDYHECRKAEMELLFLLFDLFSISPRASDRLSKVLDSFVGPIPYLKSTEEPGEGLNPRPAD